MGWFSQIFNPIEVFETTVIDPIEKTIDITNKTVETLNEAYSDTENWVKKDFLPLAGNILSIEFDKLVQSHDLISLFDNPKKYFQDAVTNEFMLTYYHVDSVVTDEALSAEISYYVMIIAAAVASYYLGPEVYMAVELTMAIIMEQLAATFIMSSIVASAIYYTLTGVAMLITTFLMDFIATYSMTAIGEAYFNFMYSGRLMLEAYALKQNMEANYASMLLDDSMFDWMAGGIALNAVMAGGDLSHGAYPNDPYTKSLMYESKGSNIGASLELLMPYDRFAGGDMFGLNGASSSPYSPLVLNV